MTTNFHWHDDIDCIQGVFLVSSLDTFMEIFFNFLMVFLEKKNLKNQPWKLLGAPQFFLKSKIFKFFMETDAFKYLELLLFFKDNQQQSYFSFLTSHELPFKFKCCYQAINITDSDYWSYLHLVEYHTFHMLVIKV